MPALTVVVATRDRPGMLDACLASLRASLRPVDELIVVDSASQDGSVAVTAVGHRARLLRCGWPGASRARNLGVVAATHEVVAFVDDDVRVAGDWAARLSEVFDGHPGAAFVTGSLGVPAHQAGAQRPVALLEHPEPAVLDGSVPVVLGHGANLAVRRGAFDAVGGFDERLGPGAAFCAAEDHDLFDRLIAAGFTGRYEPGVRAWHDQWRGRWQLLALEWRYGVGTGARLARLAVSDRARARAVAFETLWHTGVATVPTSILHRYEFGVAFVAGRLAGTAAGLAAAAVRPAPRSRRQPGPGPRSRRQPAPGPG